MVTCRSVHTLRGLRGPRADSREIGRPVCPGHKQFQTGHPHSGHTVIPPEQDFLSTPDRDEPSPDVITAIAATGVVVQTQDRGAASSLAAI